MLTNKRFRLVLASQSPRRKELLGHTRVPFDVIVSHANEDSEEKNPSVFALEIALRKGESVAATLSAGHAVVSSDTVVALEGKIYGKPRDIAEARQVLLELSGRTHQVHTAIALLIAGQTFTHVETTEVTFLPIAPKLLENYLASGDSLDKAGAYGIQGQGLTFIASLKGDYAAVMGFPLAAFCAMMENVVRPKLGWSSPWQDYFC